MLRRGSYRCNADATLQLPSSREPVIDLFIQSGRMIAGNNKVFKRVFHNAHSKLSRSLVQLSVTVL